MAMYVARLIDRVRRETLNQGYVYGDYGLANAHFLDKLNDAQDRLQSLLVPIAPELFKQTQTIPLVAGTNSYTLNGECFLGQEIDVWFSSDGQTDNYVPLPAVSMSEFSFDEDDFTTGYNIQNGQILVTPTPMSATGTLRVDYVREFRDLATRIGTINTNNATTITLDAAPVPVTESILDEAGNFIADYLCVVNDSGTMLTSAIVTTGYVTATRVFTAAVGAGVVLDVNGWVILGKYATTHTEGPRNWDRYLVSYAERVILSREEGNVNFADEDPILQAMEADILQAAENLKTRIKSPPLLNRYYR